MKKIKILFCGLLVGLSVLSYLIATHRSSTTELFRLNIEALSLNEDRPDHCIVVDGFCFVNGILLPGMKFNE